jgi:hypothetical protein
MASNTGSKSPGDELMTFRGGGLLFESLARLGQEPRVLHGDDRLRGEVLQQSDLLVCERADFLAVERNRPERYVILAQWFDHNAAGTREVNDGASQLIPGGPDGGAPRKRRYGPVTALKPRP